MVVVISGKETDLEGMSVRRLLPQRACRSVGPFVFFDHMGPVSFEAGNGIDVPPHPHIGLATVTYLFEGRILHHDSLGNKLEISPGDLNWMTAGRGIVHSERETSDLRHSDHDLHGLQLWVALPEAEEDCAPDFTHIRKEDLPVIHEAGLHMRLIAGEAFGQTAPVPVKSKLFYLDVHMDGGAQLLLPGENQEAALYIIEGSLRVDGVHHEAFSFVYIAPEEIPDIVAENHCRVMLLGGLPLGHRHIWWNFVSSRKDRIQKAKDDWQNRHFDPVPGEDDFVPLPGGVAKVSPPPAS
ncbi:pirin family protein [Thalassospira sp. TSL5-1]|uniref:pirin family protein n=1 Tax=Thalassospira sp. TSL5-1 TaxID=1544451 RepID=UPI00093C6C09|nr:pirin family protein [Thalassospira sp. TSL5-1]